MLNEILRSLCIRKSEKLFGNREKNDNKVEFFMRTAQIDVKWLRIFQNDIYSCKAGIKSKFAADRQSMMTL